MQLLGLIGGMSWESSAVYYRLVNQEVQRRLGGLHSAHCLLYSVDFALIERLQHEERWEEAGEALAAAAAHLEAAGARALVLCTNTMHKVAAGIEARVSIPLLHIADAAAAAVQRRGLGRIALLGTRFTMQEPFYRERLQAHGLEVLTPAGSEASEVNRIIYEELCLGQTLPASRRHCAAVITGLVAQGAEAVLLACTELGLLISDADAAVPVFDTTVVHAQAAVDYMLAAA